MAARIGGLNGVTTPPFAIRRESLLVSGYRLETIPMAYRIDTAAAVRRLEEVGFEPDKARVIVETVAESERLATEGDVAGLKSDMVVLKSDMAALKNELTLRIVGAQVATATLLFAALRFFD